MMKPKKLLSWVALSALLPLGTILTELPAQAQEQPVPAGPNHLIGTQPYLISQTFRAPNRGAPATTSGGATRGSCRRQDKKALTSLLPSTKLGLTVEERPTFFWYVPDATATKAEFLLFNENDTKVIHQTKFTLPQKPGIISYRLPTTAPALQAGKTYHWYLTVDCNIAGSSTSPSVEGWVERIPLSSSLAKALQTTEPQNHPALYAEAGIWHEALTTLVNLRRSSPNNGKVVAGWKELLRSVGLTSVISEPLVNVKPTQSSPLSLAD